MTTPGERMPRSNALSNAKSACSTSDRGWARRSTGPPPAVRGRPSCRSREPVPDMSRRDGVDSQPLPVPPLRLARLVLHVKEEKNTSCRRPREPIRISTIVARSTGTRLAEGLAAARAERKKVFISSAGCLTRDEKGQFLHGTSGGRSAAELLDDIEQVASRT